MKESFDEIEKSLESISSGDYVEKSKVVSSQPIDLPSQKTENDKDPTEDYEYTRGNLYLLIQK